MKNLSWGSVPPINWSILARGIRNPGKFDLSILVLIDFAHNRWPLGEWHHRKFTFCNCSDMTVISKHCHVLIMPYRVMIEVKICLWKELTCIWEVLWEARLQVRGSCSSTVNVCTHKHKWTMSKWSTLKILYGFDQFIGHVSRRVADMPKFGPCHGSHRNQRSEHDTYHMWYFSAFVPINIFCPGGLLPPPISL